MRPIAKSAKGQARSTKSSHIVNTTIRLSLNAVTLVQIKREDSVYQQGFYVLFLQLVFGHTRIVDGSQIWQKHCSFHVLTILPLENIL